MKNKDSYLAANYNKLRFKYQLDVQLLVNDTELIELLLGKLEDVDDLKEQLVEKEDLMEKCRDADVTIALLEGNVSDLKNEVEYLETRISDLYRDIGNLENENRELNSLLNKNDLF